MEEQELLAVTLQRDRTSVIALERLVEGVVAVAFGLFVAYLWHLAPPALVCRLAGRRVSGGSRAGDAGSV